MTVDHLNNWQRLPGLPQHPVWSAVFEWIESQAESAELGLHELGVGEAFVRVMEYDLKERSEAAWESHLHTIDLHYTIEGGEAIEVKAVGQLQPAGEWDAKNDSQVYAACEESGSRLEVRQGDFCIFFPQDGHMPALKTQDHGRIRKLVAKIPMAAIV